MSASAAPGRGKADPTTAFHVSRVLNGTWSPRQRRLKDKLMVVAIFDFDFESVYYGHVRVRAHRNHGYGECMGLDLRTPDACSRIVDGSTVDGGH